MTYSSKAVNGGDTTSSDITGLDLSTQYNVRIASVNELGTGNYSGIVRATTYGCRFNTAVHCIYTYLICMYSKFTGHYKYIDYYMYIILIY